MSSKPEHKPVSRLGRLARRAGAAMNPEAALALRETRALTRTLEAWRNDEATRARSDADRLQQLEAAVAALNRESATVRHAIERLRAIAAGQHDVAAEIARRGGIRQRAVEEERRVHARLARLARLETPIIIGPWTGEVGFEVLYWIPFLQWVRATYGVDPKRMIVVSRGGVRGWYQHVASEYEDIFTHATPEQFRAATVDRKKQRLALPFDRAVVTAVRRARGIRRGHLIHPAMMYTINRAIWRYDTGITNVDAAARYRRFRLPKSPAGIDASLPATYVAVRFYFSTCFPDTPDNRRFAARVVESLAEKTDVVLLNAGIAADDHHDFLPQRHPRVHTLTAAMRPETNLAVQTDVIARARAFIGTYGGYCYLAPMYGVNAVAFYSRMTFKPIHLELAQRVFTGLGRARLVAVDVAQAALLGDALAAGGGVPATS